MSDIKPLRVVVVGCGNISQGYGNSLKAKADVIEILGAFDVDADRAKAFVDKYGGRVYAKLDDVV